MSPVEPIANPTWCERHTRTLLVVLLVVSLALRVWLAGTGGEGYWPDEMRYTSASREAAWQFEHGTARAGWLALIGTADHLFFKIAGLPVAFWELHHGNNATLVASWFGFFSVLSIGLIFAIARAAGAGARESLLAALFAAGASSLFYYSRHFFPYDLSLFFCLLALWLGLGREAWWRSGLAGLSAGLGFLSYNGYWLLGGLVLVFHVLSGGPVRRMIGRAALAGTGLLAPIVAAGLAARMLDRDLIASFREFSHTITQGDFGRGWILVWQYLWAAEGVVLVAWLLLVAMGLGLVHGPARRRLGLWVGAAALIYLGLVVCADVLRTFVVYGRTARMIVPFLCLAAAAGADELAKQRSRRWAAGTLLAVAVVGAAWQMSVALRQVFPEDFLQLAARRAQEARAESPALLRILNADRLGEGRVMGEARPHTILVRYSHPLQFAPYLFEGLDEARRQRFRADDISMQLVAVPTVQLPDVGRGYPGPVRLRLKFPADRMQPGVSEPLLTSGVAGKANFLYVQYVDANHVRFGYDSWGQGGSLGDPMEVDLGTEHTVLLSSGAQLPPDESSRPGDLGPRTWLRLQRTVLVAMGGKVALGGAVAMNPVEARSIFIGANFAGGSSTRQEFSGEIRGIDRAEWRDVLNQLPADRLTPEEATERLASVSPGPEWSGYCGPLRLRIRVARGAVGQAEPLVVSGKTGAGDFIYVRHLSEGRVSFCYDHWGVGGTESAPVDLGAMRDVDVVISHGGLLPPATAKIFADRPAFAALRRSVTIALNGKVVLVSTIAPYETSPATITVGRNLIGGSTTAEKMGSEILSIASEPADAVLKLLGGEVVP